MDYSHPTYMDSLFVMDSLREYASPKAKLTHMVQSREIVRVRRGLYIKPGDTAVSLKTLANKIYGPSYISFEYALAYHGLIPERAITITSASLGKNKNKLFTTPLSVFSYQSVQPSVYPYGILRLEEHGSPFLIASKEKALCDLLANRGQVSTMRAFEALLDTDVRIDHDELMQLSREDIAFLAPRYRKKAVSLLLNYLQLRHDRA
jgi:hypothetical protein